jgi:D-alanyl-lipoteichoic acid acyltransferase DltB (MBOAT superfamily)
MLFNSFEFALFLPLVFFLYWFVFQRNLRMQNALVVAASYLFYGWWDWRFLGLIFFSSIADYVIGKSLHDSDDPKRRKLFLILSLSINLGILGFFKYYNFFVDSFVSSFGMLGVQMNESSLNIILPVGISFYTFQTLSYTIDIYRKQLEPTRDVSAFFAFVSFFPQLVAGPIERAVNLLPQFHKTRTFDVDKAKDGIRQIFWGLFKKIVIADTCATNVNIIFENSETMSGSALLLGAFLFAFQIYGDFSGYSDIAIGTARLFGFGLMQNFATPYFARDIGEFWRRWHISLSTWFRDYIYIPMGGSRVSKYRQFWNILVTFTVSGFWHGANWTFVIWGFLNGLYYMPSMLLNRNKKKKTKVVAEGKLLPSPIELFQMARTFFLTLIAWVFFRANDMGQAIQYIGDMLSPSLLSSPAASLKGFAMKESVIYALLAIITLVVIEWFQRDKQHGLQFVADRPLAWRWAAYTTMIAIILVFRQTGGNLDFIYFQF